MELLETPGAREVLPRFLLCRRRCLSPCTLSTGMPSLPWGRNPKIRTLWSFCKAARSSVMKNTPVVNKNICRDFFVPRNLDTWRSKSKTSSPPTQTLLTIAIYRGGERCIKETFSFSMNCLPTLLLGVGCFGEEGRPKNIAAQSAFFVVRTPQGWSLVSDKDYTTYVTLHKAKSASLPFRHSHLMCKIGCTIE